jgi:hypothetical protein
VHGRVANASRETVTRVVCYCDDCQAFAHHLKRADILDANGGSDIVQVAPASLSFQRGADRIACVRLHPKGLYRFYATCCNTPLGNTLGTKIPFIGIVAHAFEGDADDAFGAPIGAIFGKFAVGTAPKGSDKLNVPLLARAIRKVLGWKLRGKAHPHPYFDRGAREPNRPVTILTRDERDAVRALCGPSATTVHA